MAGVKGGLNGGCVAIGQEQLNLPTGHILYREGCSPMSGFPGSRATTDYGYITGRNPSSSSSPGLINFYN